MWRVSEVVSQILLMRKSMPWVLVRSPVPMTKMSSRAMRKSPPSMVMREVAAEGRSWVTGVHGVTPKREWWVKMASMISDSLSRTLLAMRPLITLSLTAMAISRVKNRL